MRLHWRVPVGSTHPTETTVKASTETGAVDRAVSLIDDQVPNVLPRIVRAEIGSPGGHWRPVEWAA